MHAFRDQRGTLSRDEIEQGIDQDASSVIDLALNGLRFFHVAHEATGVRDEDDLVASCSQVV